MTVFHITFAFCS